MMKQTWRFLGRDILLDKPEAPAYELRPAVAHNWSRLNHPWPCAETDRIDAVLNELAETTITLSPHELELSRRYGRFRRSKSRHCNDRQVSTENPLVVDIRGVMGEMAVCKYLGIEYKFTVNTFRTADLPFNIEVRATRWITGHCKVQPHDPDARRVVMAIVTDLQAPVFLPGWITALEGKQFPLRDPHNVGMPMHFVPQNRLRPMLELRAIAQS